MSRRRGSLLNRLSHLALLFVVSLALVASSGCLDEEPELECPRITPTGGDFVGRWEALDYCITRPPIGMVATCPSLRAAVEGVTASGWIEFRADGSYDENTILNYGERLDFPYSCFATAAPSCRELGPILAAQAKTDILTATAFCRGSDHCRCASRTEEVYKRGGQVRREGNRLIEGMNAIEYSVVGDELRLQAPGLLYRFARM